MDATHIDDPADGRVADYRRLNDASYRRHLEASGPFHKGLFVAEGWLALERLLPSRFAVRSVLVDAARVGRVAELVGRRPVTVFAARQEVLDEIVGFPLHRGVVAAAERGRDLLATDVVARARTLVVTESVNDAENMASIIRNAAALGGDGLLLDPTSCDPLTRRTVRVSVGHALSLPFARVPWPHVVGTLRDAGFTTVALSPRADASDIVSVDVGPEDRVAIVLGAEGPGLSDEAIDACDVVARIGMSRGVDSLNVAAAGAIAMHRLFSVRAR